MIYCSDKLSKKVIKPYLNKLDRTDLITKVSAESKFLMEGNVLINKDTGKSIKLRTLIDSSDVNPDLTDLLDKLNKSSKRAVVVKYETRTIADEERELMTVFKGNIPIVKTVIDSYDDTLRYNLRKGIISISSDEELIDRLGDNFNSTNPRWAGSEGEVYDDTLEFDYVIKLQRSRMTINDGDVKVLNEFLRGGEV